MYILGFVLFLKEVLSPKQVTLKTYYFKYLNLTIQYASSGHMWLPKFKLIKEK
jgi:hypothetical protein